MNSYGGYDGAGDGDDMGGGVVGGASQETLADHQIHFYGIASVLCMIMSVFVIMLIMYMLFAFASKYMPSPRRYDDERGSFAGLKSNQLPFQGTLPNARYLSTSSGFLGASDGGPSFWNIGDVDKTAEALNRMNKSVTRDGTNDMDDFGEVVKGQNGDVNAYGKVDTRKEIIGRDKMGPGQYYKFYGRGGPSRFI